MKFILEVLLSYFFPINSLSKQKRVMRRSMRKPQGLPFKCFSARLTERNNYLTLFPGSSATNKMPPEDFNNILLHAVPNGWAKQAYLQGQDFQMKIYKSICKLSEIMEVVDKIYEGGNTYKTPSRTNSNRASHDGKRKGGESASPTNPETGRAGKRKTRNAVHPIYHPTGGKICLVHGPGHSEEQCKLLKDYSAKYSDQQPNK